MKKLVYAFSLSVLAVLASCTKDTYMPMPASSNPANNTVTISGQLEHQGTTIYQYGTHILVLDTVTYDHYALISNTIDLDQYVGQDVILTAVLINDYPVDGGPDFYEVTNVATSGN